MYKICVYVVTYKNEERVNQNIDAFFSSIDHVDKEKYSFQYHVINNHSSFNLTSRFADQVKVLHNSLRLDRSCGHLSRDYNSALMHGFVDLNNPACNQVICAHDDSIWHADWFEKLMRIHETFTFYAGDYGCSMTSYLPEAVKKIGLWDERFAGIGYHEADYFMRARIYNSDKSSINDHFGGRVLNPTQVFFDHVGPNPAKHEHVNASLPYHTVSRRVFAEKWAVHPEQWATRTPTPPTRPLIPTYMYYPYFELAIDDLEGKNYIFEQAGLQHFKSEWH